MAATVTLQSLREAVRLYTGSPNENQLTTEEIDDAINHFYREVLPPLAPLEELKGFYSFDANDEEEKDLPDSVVNVSPPCMIDNVISGFFHNSSLFWARHAGASAGVPEDILLVGRTLYLGPPADDNGPYSIKMASINRPDKLESAGETLIADRFRHSVELGAAVSVLLKREDDEAVTLLNKHLITYVGALQALGVQINPKAATATLRAEK
ncbi:MAG: hypothetical protein ACLFUL_06290 [Desulfobacteraceae bacterium]